MQMKKTILIIATAASTSVAVACTYIRFLQSKQHGRRER